MMSKMKRFLVGTMSALMVLGSVTTAFAATSPTTATAPAAQTAVAAEKTSTGITAAAVNTNKKGEVAVLAVKKTNKTTVKLTSKMTVNGVKYTVYRIGGNAFKNCTKVKTVELPSSIEKISAKAFSNCKTLKTINVTSKQKVAVSKNAFKGTNTKNMTIKVNVSKKGMTSAEYKAFVKSLKKAGFKGKVVSYK